MGDSFIPVSIIGDSGFAFLPFYTKFRYGRVSHPDAACSGTKTVEAAFYVPVISQKKLSESIFEIFSNI
jgi:hypothetical protein